MPMQILLKEQPSPRLGGRGLRKEQGMKDTEELRQENDKLREVLKEIAQMDDSHSIGEARSLAMAVLAYT